MFGHVFNQLAAYAEGQLSSHERERVERHLETCDTCRGALVEVRSGIDLASTLRAEPMPDDIARRIRASVTSAKRTDETGSYKSRVWQATAAAMFLAAALAGYWHFNRPWIQLQAATVAPTRFEDEGRRIHERLASGATALTFRSSDEQALWQWLATEKSPVTSLVVSRPERERARFVPVGAAVHSIDGVQTSVLSYRIDGRPVTLALARSREVVDAPPSAWWSKRVFHRRGSDGANTLTWTVGGGTYVMVSELDGVGQTACRICHTAPDFVAALDELRP
jgi:anti-sigma factor RsiW